MGSGRGVQCTYPFLLRLVHIFSSFDNSITLLLVLLLGLPPWQAPPVQPPAAAARRPTGCSVSSAQLRPWRRVSSPSSTLRSSPFRPLPLPSLALEPCASWKRGRKRERQRKRAWWKIRRVQGGKPFCSTTDGMSCWL